jgi:sugar phosphate isomerase/epimerase
MNLGLTSYACAWAIGIPGFPPPAAPMHASALLRRAVHHGLRVVQLCDNLPLTTLPPAALRDLAAEARDLGLTLELGGRGLTADSLEQHLAMCAALDTRLLRFVIDGPDFHPSLADTARLLRSRLPALDAAGLTLAIENHDRFRAAELARLIEEIDSPRVGICLDTANSLGAGEDFATVLDALAPHTVNFHVKDVVVARFPHNHGFTVKGCAAGRGVVGPALPAALDRLRALGRCESVLIETWAFPDADTAETITREDTMIADGAAFLRPLLARS